MKKALLAALLLAGLTYLLLRPSAPLRAPEKNVVVPVPAPPPAGRPVPALREVGPPPPVAAPGGTASVSPVMDILPVWTSQAAAPLPVEPAMEALRHVFRNYGQRFRGNPVGNNQEITAALAGDNPGGVQFLDPERDRINDRGELVDGWGTPYFFHQLSGVEMEIHSAGPDGQRGTSDDLIVR